MSKERAIFTGFKNRMERRNAFSSPIRKNLEFLRDTYGIRVKMGVRNSHDIEEVSAVEKLGLISASIEVAGLRRKIEKYPPELIRASGVKTIRLLKDFEYKNPNTFAIAAYMIDTMYLQQYYCDGLHHELLHFLDRTEKIKFINLRYKDPYLASKALTNSRLWSMLFPSDSYVGESPELLKMADEEVRGFACKYGMVSQTEDRATIAAIVMKSPKETEIRAKDDRLLFKKICLIKYFLEMKSGGLMDDQYFADLKDGKVKKGYWGKRDKS
jgi:hypothetical protein